MRHSQLPPPLQFSLSPSFSSNSFLVFMIFHIDDNNTLRPPPSSNTILPTCSIITMMDVTFPIAALHLALFFVILFPITLVSPLQLYNSVDNNILQSTHVEIQAILKHMAMTRGVSFLLLSLIILRLASLSSTKRFSMQLLLALWSTDFVVQWIAPWPNGNTILAGGQKLPEITPITILWIILGIVGYYSVRIDDLITKNK